MAEPTEWTPKFDEQKVRGVIDEYSRLPQLFNERDDDLEVLEKHASYYRIPFTRTKEHQEGYVSRVIKQAGRGWAEGFSTLPMEKVDDFLGTTIGGEAEDTHEAIARNLGHLAGFVGYLPGAKVLRKLGAFKIAGAVSAVKGKSAPMLVANFAQKKLGKTLEPFMKDLPEWATEGVMSDMAQGAFHLGTASAVSSWTHGVNEIFASAGFGFGAGAVFRGIGNMKGFGERLNPSQLKQNGSPNTKLMSDGQIADLGARTMAGAAFQGLPSTIQGATTEEQVYAYTLGAFFGFKEMPYQTRTSREFLHKSLSGDHGPDPEMNPRYDAMTKEMKEIIKRDFRVFFGEEESQHIVYDLVKGKVNLSDIDALAKEYKTGMEVDPVSGEAYSKALTKEEINQYKEDFIKDPRYDESQDLDMHIQDIVDIPGRLVGKGGYIDQVFPDIAPVERIKLADTIYKKWSTLHNATTKKPKQGAEQEIIGFIEKETGRKLDENESGWWKRWAENTRKKEWVEQIEIKDGEVGMLAGKTNSVGNKKDLSQQKMIIEEIYEKTYEALNGKKSENEWFRVLDHIIWKDKEYDLGRAERNIAREQEIEIRKDPDAIEGFKDWQIRDIARQNASQIMAESNRKLHDKMAEDGYYYFGGKGDAKKKYFVKLHPLIEKDTQLVKRLLAKSFKVFRGTPDKNTPMRERYNKNHYNTSFDKWVNEEGMEHNRMLSKENAKYLYEQQYVSNILYEISNNGYEASEASFSKNFAKLLDGNKYINNAKAFNKRAQIWFNSGLSANPREVQAILESKGVNDLQGTGTSQRKFRVGLFTEADAVHKQGDINLSDGAEKYLESSDGAILAREEVIDALNSDKGLPTDGKFNKSFIVSRDPVLGTLLGKYGMQLATPELSAYMKEKGIHMMIPSSAAKQVGERYDFFGNLELVPDATGKALEINFNGKLFDIPIRDFRTVMSEVTTKKYLKPVQLPKQMYSVLSAYGFNGAKSESIADMYETLSNRAMIGTEDGIKALEAYKESKSPESIKRAVDNMEEMPINEIFDLLRSPDHPEVSQKMYEKILKLNHEYVAGLAEEGEISRSEMERYKEGVADFESVIGRLNRVFPDGSIGAYMHKFSRDYRMQAMRNYVVQKITKPKIDNSASSRMRPWEIGMQMEGKNTAELRNNQDIFFLDEGFRELQIKDTMFKGGRIKLGELWETRDQYTGALEEKVNDILMGTVMRVPMDSMSGAHSLKFAGFTGVKGLGSLLHPRSMKALGGADLDGDKALIFFGGESSGFKKSWREMYAGEKNEYVDANLNAEKHNKDAIDPANNLSYGEILAIRDEMTEAQSKHQTAQYSPYWRGFMSDGASNGRDFLGTAVTARASIIGAYNAMRGAHSQDSAVDKIRLKDSVGNDILDKDGKPMMEDIILRKDGYSVPYYDGEAGQLRRIIFETRNGDVDLQRFREMSRAAIALGSDPMDEMGIRGEKFTSKILDTLFNYKVYDVVKGRMELNEVETSQINSGKRENLKGKGLHSVFGNLNNVLYGKNHNDNRRWSYSEIMGGVEKFNYMPSHTKNTFLPQLSESMKGINWSDNVFRRVNEAKLNQIYFDHAEEVRGLDWLRDAMGRDTMSTIQGRFIQQIFKKELFTEAGLDKMAKSEPDFVKFISETQVTKLGFENPIMGQVPRAFQPVRQYDYGFRRAYLEHLVLKGEDFLINDLSDMASLKSITDVIISGKLNKKTISRIHDKVDEIKSKGVWAAKQRRGLDDALNLTATDAKRSKAVKNARKAFGLDDKSSSKIDQIQTDKLIREFKSDLSASEKELFDMLYLGTYSKGNQAKLDAAMELMQDKKYLKQARLLFKMLKNTSLIRAGISSSEVSDASVKKFFKNYDDLLTRADGRLTPEQEGILMREATPKDVTSLKGADGKLVQNELIDGEVLSEKDRFYLDNIGPFEGLQEGKVTDPILKQTYYNLKEHLKHYHNLDVRNLNGLFRGLFKKDINQANKMDLQTLDRYLADMRNGTWFNRMMDWFTGKSKDDLPAIKRSNYWKFPRAINRDLLRYPAMMEWTEDIGPYKNKLGNTIENARTIRPTAVIGEISQLSARTQELSMQTFEEEANKFRDELRPYTSALEDGDILFNTAVARRELGYMKAKLRPKFKNNGHKLTEAEMHYQENWNGLKDFYERVKGKAYIIPTENGNIKMTGEAVINKINNIITEANIKTHKWLAGQPDKVNKWLKIAENSKGEVTWAGLDKLRIEFHSYVNDTIKRNKSIPIDELGIDGIRQITKRILISQTPYRLRNPKTLLEQRKSLEVQKFDPTGDLGAEFYYPHMSFNRKLADKKLRAAIKNVVNDSTLTSQEISREVKKINYQYKNLTGDFMAKDEMGDNFDIMQEALAAQAGTKKQRKETILGSNYKKVGNQFGRDAHIGGWDINPEAYESYMRNAINTFYKQTMQVTARTAMHNFNNTFFRQSNGDKVLTNSWMNFFKLYTQSAMGYPTHIPEKIMNDPNMKIKGTAYKWLADSTAKKRIDYIRKRLGVGRKELEKWNLDEAVIDELSGIEYTQLQSWGSLEAKWQLASLLAHPKSSIANLYGGTVHTWISAGYDNLKKARDFEYLRTNINPKWKSMKDVERWMQELGIIEEFLVHEAGLNPALKSKKSQAFLKDAMSVMKRDPNFSDTSLLQLSKKHGITRRIFDVASSFMRVPERTLRRDSFMAHYIQAKNKFGGAIKNYNSPFLINMAKRGVKGTQFLYSAPYRPLWTNSTLGRVMSRFQLWSWNSVRFRNDVIKRAHIAGYQEGTEEFEAFKRLAVADAFMLGMANMFQYSLFENALPAPWNWFQDTADYLMGDEEARERAFYGSALGPIQAVTPPSMRLLGPMFKWMMNDDASELTDYYLWTIPPFGRLMRDVAGPGGMLENPYYSITKFTGMPIMQASKLLKGEKPEAIKGKFIY